MKSTDSVLIARGWISCWSELQVVSSLLEKNPWPTLTLTVSLEAIFLSTFVMIGQNRQADFAQRKADHDFTEQELELKLNTELTKAIHALAKEIHEKVVSPASPPAS